MREQFPLFDKHPHLIYLDSAATSHKPRCVIEAISRFYAEENATVHRTAYKSSLLATERYNDARETVRRFLNAPRADQIVFTRGTTDALNLVALSWGKTHLRPGDTILVSEMEHHSNFVPWQMLAKETGARLELIPMDSSGVLDYAPHIRPGVKLIAVGHVSNVTGTINPIADIAQLAHAHGAILVVDGAQAAPHLKIDVQALGCDFYAFSGHKCYGPTGIGALFGKHFDAMPPVQGGGDMIEKVSFRETTYAPPPLRFEAGTPIIGGAIALKAALDWIGDFESHETALRLRLEENLRAIEGLRILGTAPQKGPLTTFVIEGVHPLDLAAWLDLKEIAIRSGHLCAQPCLEKFGCKAAARASLGAYNTVEEVDRFAEELKRAAQILRR